MGYSTKKDEGNFFNSLFGTPTEVSGRPNGSLAELLSNLTPPPPLNGAPGLTERDPFGFSSVSGHLGSGSSGSLSSLTTLASLLGSGGSPIYGSPPLPPVPLPRRMPLLPARPKKASLKDDLLQEVSKVFRSRWSTRDGNVVPADDSITLDNDAVKLDATVLYADLAGSTTLVDEYASWFAAEIYKTFLRCSGRIVRSEGGEITAYDGDRIMAVYLGPSKNTSAVRSALKINYAVQQIVSTAARTQYPNTVYKVSHKIGIDTSTLFVAKTGVRGANDLVWVGRAANYAAKMSMLDESYRTYITPEVYNVLDSSVKDRKSLDGKPVWEPRFWTKFDNRLIYASNWWYEIS